MDTSRDELLPGESTPLKPRRLSIAQMIILLLIGAIVLMVFNFLLGDFRRKQNAIAQAQLHAQHYTRLAGESGLLPLNLEPKIDDTKTTRMFQMEWLSSDQVRKFRTSDTPVIIAQTVELPQLLTTYGRAVILYHEGNYTTKWMTLSEFDQQITQQTESIDR